MKIILDSGTELTWEEVIEVVERFKGLFTESPVTIPFQTEFHQFEHLPYEVTCTDDGVDWYDQPYCTCGNV